MTNYRLQAWSNIDGWQNTKFVSTYKPQIEREEQKLLADPSRWMGELRLTRIVEESLTGTITGAWNLDFTTRRAANIKRTIRQRLRCNPHGKGNKAWKRAEANERAFRAGGGFYVSDFVTL